MRELIKKTVLAGLGTAVVSTAKVREGMHALTEQGRLTTEEAERFTQEMCNAGENEMQEIRDHISERLDRLTKGVNLAHAEDVERLTQRVENLEKRLNLLEDQLASGASPEEGSEQP